MTDNARGYAMPTSCNCKLFVGVGVMNNKALFIPAMSWGKEFDPRSLAPKQQRALSGLVDILLLLLNPPLGQSLIVVPNKREAN